MVQFIEDEAPGATAEAAPVPQTSKRTPWHLWVVGGVSLLWNLFGAVDYTMSQLRNRDYLAASSESMGIATDQMIAWIDSFPAWQTGFWALGVWGALLGSTLLLARSTYAVWGFAASLLGLVVTQLYQALMPRPEWADAAAGMTVVIWSVATFLLIYAVSMKRKGVLG